MAFPVCEVCGAQMAFNFKANAGDAGWVCVVNDTAHRAERKRARDEAKAIRAAVKPPGASQEEIAQIGAEFNPDGGVD